MAVGDLDDGSSSRIPPLPFLSFSINDRHKSLSAAELPLQLPLSNPAANNMDYYSPNGYLPSLPHQQQPKQSASTPRSPKLSTTSPSASAHSSSATKLSTTSPSASAHLSSAAKLSTTSPSASAHSSSATAIPATGGHLQFKDEETSGHPVLESEATGGRDVFEDEATGGRDVFENEADGGWDVFEDEADGAVGAIASYETNELVNSKPALKVIEMGFPSEVVETVIHLKVFETGEDYSTAESLVDAVIAYQMAMNDEDGQRNEESSSGLRNSPSHQNGQLENVCQQNFSSNGTTQQRDRAFQKKKKGKVKSPRNGMTTATGNRHQTNNKSSGLDADGETMEGENTNGNSLASAASQMLSPFLLKEENKKMKSSRLCKICLENEIRIVFLPCGHLICCAECSSLVRNCTICDRAIKGSVKVFLA